LRDHPGVSCQACREIRDVDGVAPACESGECVVPPLGPVEARVLDLRSRALSLRGVMEPAQVLSALGASVSDLLLLSEVELGLLLMQAEGAISKRPEGGHGV